MAAFLIFSQRMILNSVHGREGLPVALRHPLRHKDIHPDQIQGSLRDEIVLQDKLRFDQEYLERQSLFFDLKIMLLTVIAVVRSRGVSH